MTFMARQTEKHCFAACSEDKVKNGLCDCVNRMRKFVPQDISESTEFIYEGWMSQEAQRFFDGHTIIEERDGVATVGTFIKLASGKTHLPSKGDVFTKHENNTLTVKSIYRE
jgi:hypothetical protein